MNYTTNTFLWDNLYFTGVWRYTLVIKIYKIKISYFESDLSFDEDLITVKNNTHKNIVSNNDLIFFYPKKKKNFLKIIFVYFKII
jgi:hypothetical protein